jgi:NAD(P)-dependent dehydrogenase (short-subunit alcohol dehydrogenase family)
MNQAARYPSLKGKNVFITGGATGIGASMVEAFAGQGARVAFIDILDADAGSLCAEVLKKTGIEPVYRHVDVTAVEKLQAAIREAAREFGTIDVLVNNVANDMRHSPLDISADYWRKCLAINLDATFFAAQAVIPLMQKSGGGAIINFTSINAYLGLEQMPGYVAAKAGIIGLSKALARQYGKDNIRSNSIVPGWIATQRQLDTWLTADEERKWMDLVALKCRINPEDVANLALFLAAEDSSKITAQEFVIDAGRI